MDDTKDTKLEIGLEVVQSHQMSDEAQIIIGTEAKRFGVLERFIEHRMGSAWYVEFPFYIDKLIDEGREEYARRVAHDMFKNASIEGATINIFLWDEIDRAYYNR